MSSHFEHNKTLTQLKSLMQGLPTVLRRKRFFFVSFENKTIKKTKMRKTLKDIYFT